MTSKRDISLREKFWRIRNNRLNVLFGLPLIFSAAMLLISSALPGPSQDTTQRADNQQFISFAYNLVKSGVYSHRGEGSRPATPTRLREPLYPLTLAIPLYLSERTDEISLRCLVRGKKCADVRLLLMFVNLTTISLLIAGAFLAARLVIGSWLGAYAVVGLLFAANYFVIKDTAIALNSEPLAALLLLGHSTFLFLSIRQGLRRKAAPVLAGVFLGLLVLTKAAFLYWLFSLAVLLSLYIILASVRGRMSLREILVPTLCLFMFASLFPALWSVRNHHHFDEFALAERGGSILIGRAAFLHMHKHEYRAGMCKWTPHRYFAFRDLICKDISESDMVRFERNQHREGTFDNMKMKEKRRLDELRKTSTKELSADEAFRQSGFGKILSQPLKHIALIPLFAYRGMWVDIESRWNNWYPQYPQIQRVFLVLGKFSERISPFFVPVLILAFLGSLLARSWDLVFFMLPAMFSYSIYSAVTHFIPRYSTPLIPILIVTFVLVATWITRWVSRRLI